MKETLSKDSGARETSRRSFLAGAAAAVAVPNIIPASALGKDGAAAPGDRIGMGFIGVGGRGSGHVRGFLGMKDVQVLAVCDPYKSKCNKSKAQVDRRYKGCGTYQDFRRLLARPDIDAVVIASPENWHALHSIHAVRAGKDVFVEKALSLTVAEGRALCKAVRRYGRVLQVGTQQRSDGRFRLACELARNGYLGKLRTIKVGVPGGRKLPTVPPKDPPADIDYDIWLGPAPWTPYNDLKCSFNWYFIYDYCIGWIQSWGVHHVDIALWGAPALAAGQVQVEGTAVFPAEGLANTSVTWNVSVVTPDGLHLHFTDDKAQRHGCRFFGDKGMVHVDRGRLEAEPESLLKVALRSGDEHLYESNNHHGNFLECIRTRRDPVSPVESGHAATTLTIVCDIATRLGRKVTWDWQAEKFIGDEAANRYLSRPMRPPWSL